MSARSACNGGQSSSISCRIAHWATECSVPFDAHGCANWAMERERICAPHQGISCRASRTNWATECSALLRTRRVRNNYCATTRGCDDQLEHGRASDVGHLHRLLRSEVIAGHFDASWMRIASQIRGDWGHFVRGQSMMMAPRTPTSRTAGLCTRPCQPPASVARPPPATPRTPCGLRDDTR